MIGLGADPKGLRQRVAVVWMGAALLFIVVTLGGQLRHVYYQLCLVLPAAILAAGGVRTLWTRGALTRGVLASCLLVHAATTYTVLYAPSNHDRYFADRPGLEGPIHALKKHVPEGSYFVTSSRDPRLYFNASRRGYFGPANWKALSACMSGTSEWLLLDQANEKRLKPGSTELKAVMQEVLRDPTYSLWRRRSAQ